MTPQPDPTKPDHTQPDHTQPEPTAPEQPGDGPAAGSTDPAKAIFERARTSARGNRPRPRGTKRPTPEQRSGARSDDRDPQPAGRVVADLLVEHGWQVEVAVHGVLTRWPEIVGPEVAAHSTPESYADGKLVIRAESTAWATQLRYLAANLVARLNAELGDGTVESVTVRGPDAPSWSHGRRSVRGRGPRDTYG